MKKTEMKTEKKNEPYMKFQSGTVQAAIWENIGKNSEGKEYKNYSVSLSKGYTEDEGKTWKNTSSFQKRDLCALNVVLQHTINFLYLSEEKD